MQHHPLPTALAVLCNGAPEDAQSRRLWPRWAALLPHVLSAVSVVDDNTDPDIAADASWLLDRAGTYLQTQGRARQARPLLESALTLSETAYGPDHPDVGTALNNLAWILQAVGDPAAARPLAERALAIAEINVRSRPPRRRRQTAQPRRNPGGSGRSRRCPHKGRTRTGSH